MEESIHELSISPSLFGEIFFVPDAHEAKASFVTTRKPG